MAAYAALLCKDTGFLVSPPYRVANFRSRARRAKDGSFFSCLFLSFFYIHLDFSFLAPLEPRSKGFRWVTSVIFVRNYLCECCTMEIFNLFISYSFDNRFMAIVKIGAWSRALGHFNLRKRFFESNTFSLSIHETTFFVVKNITYAFPPIYYGIILEIIAHLVKLFNKNHRFDPNIYLSNVRKPAIHLIRNRSLTSRELFSSRDDFLRRIPRFEYELG